MGNVVAITAAVMIYGGAMFAAYAYGVDPLLLIVDTADVANDIAYAGLFSNAGIFLWIAAGAVCLYASWDHANFPSERRAMLLAGGLLTWLLAIDDLFRVHDLLLPQSLCYTVYASAALFLLVRFQSTIRRLDAPLFLFAGVCLAGSIGVDLLQNHLPLSYAASQVVEEGLKFLGVVAWSLFWLSAVNRRPGCAHQRRRVDSAH